MKYTKEDICNMIFLAQSMEKGWERPVAQELYNEFYKMNDREVALKHQLQDKNTEITALKNELHIKKRRITQLTSENMTHEYLESEREHYGDITVPHIELNDWCYSGSDLIYNGIVGTGTYRIYYHPKETPIKEQQARAIDKIHCERDIKPELWKAWFFAKGLEEDDFKTVSKEMARFKEWYKQTYDDTSE